MRRANAALAAGRRVFTIAPEGSPERRALAMFYRLDVAGVIPGASIRNLHDSMMAHMGDRMRLTADIRVYELRPTPR